MDLACEVEARLGPSSCRLSSRPRWAANHPCISQHSSIVPQPVIGDRDLSRIDATNRCAIKERCALIGLKELVPSHDRALSSGPHDPKCSSAKVGLILCLGSRSKNSMCCNSQLLYLLALSANFALVFLPGVSVVVKGLLRCTL